MEPLDLQEYQVNLEVFQGPLDLLLFLIRKKKLDIHDIPIAVITKEYLSYLDRKDKINLEREAEFLLIAALLIYIKSQMLLPREAMPGDEDDPRRILVDRLLEFQRIKAASRILREKEQGESKRWRRKTSPPKPDSEELDLHEISLFDLSEAFFVLMKKRERENMLIISSKEVSIEEKMEEIIAILKEKEFLDFFAFFTAQESIEEALVSFLSLLELVRNRIVVALQERLFQPIKVWLRREAEA
jgi:segregation and condensation protein A